MRNQRAIWGSLTVVPALLLAVGCHNASTTDDSDTNLGAVQEADSTDPVKAAKNKAVKRWTDADENLISTIWIGDDDKGTLYTPLFRGGFPGVEDYIYTPANHDCTTSKTTLRVDWNRSKNEVKLLVKGRGYPVRPSVHRTEGVEWFPDQFHNAPKDVTNAAFRLWIVLGSTTRTSRFWYNPTTLQLQGSDFDFPNGPPAGLIPQPFPIISITGSEEFDPDSRGNVIHEWTAAYDHVTVESGTFSRSWATFAPIDLCQAAPLQPGISQLRPYVSPWQPPDIAPTWDQMLHAGMGFDVQIDERTDPNDAYGGNLPYVFSGISYHGNMTAIQGGVPNGWGNSILASFQNVAPVIFPIPNGNGKHCQAYLQEPHVTAPRFCEGQH